MGAANNPNFSISELLWQSPHFPICYRAIGIIPVIISNAFPRVLGIAPVIFYFDGFTSIPTALTALGYVSFVYAHK